MPRTYTTAFKIQIVTRVLNGASQLQVATENNIPPQNISRWMNDPRFHEIHQPPHNNPQIIQPVNMPPPPQNPVQPPNPQPPHPPNRNGRYLRALNLLHNFLGIQDEEKANIGEMDSVCEHCNAVKYRKESAGFCCHSGKVLLPQPEQIPPTLRTLLGLNLFF